jgi:hypothetical protein
MATEVMLSCTVVDDGDGHVHVMLGLKDPHLQHCPSCLAMYALRISSAFVDAIDQLRRDDREPGEARGEHGHLH